MEKKNRAIVAVERGVIDWVVSTESHKEGRSRQGGNALIQVVIIEEEGEDYSKTTDTTGKQVLDMHILKTGSERGGRVLIKTDKAVFIQQQFTDRPQA